MLLHQNGFFPLGWDRRCTRLTIHRLGDAARSALRKLRILHATTRLESLRIPSGNRLEALRGDRAGQHSIRINDRWRICFVWAEGNAHHVEIVDYH